MDLQLTDKTALVTGSTAGIGFAIASLFAQEGAAVVVNGRSQKRVDEALERVTQQHQHARVTGVAAESAVPWRLRLMERHCGSMAVWCAQSYEVHRFRRSEFVMIRTLLLFIAALVYWAGRGGPQSALFAVITLATVSRTEAQASKRLTTARRRAAS